MPHVFTVRELTLAVGEVLGGQFPFVWVRGQVGNLSRPASGHVYFTLRDADAALSVVWFRNRRREGAGRGVDPLTGEVFAEDDAFVLSEGAEVLAAGRIGVYAPRGVYQLVAELVQEYGVGDLHLRFEALKRKLAGLGYFDLSRKRPLPAHPERVAVVTAPGGAAIRDFLRIASERGRGAQIRIYPSLVQGQAAPAQIVEAMARAVADAWAEVVVLIRGGGSLEDLWAFNEEAVAKAVFECPLPVVAGIGHETDVCLADLTADLRAATPSHAAQLLWPERAALAQQVDGLETGLLKSFARFLALREAGLERLAQALAWLSPERRLERQAQALDREARALDTAMRSLLERLASGLDLLKARLVGLDPEAPLTRGYSLVTVRRTGRFLRDPAEVAPGHGLDIRTRGGVVGARVEDPGESPSEP